MSLLLLGAGLGADASAPPPSIVTNGTFDADTDWTLTNDFVISGGVLACSGAAGIKRCIQEGAGAPYAEGRTYRIEWDLVARIAGSVSVNIGTDVTGVSLGTTGGGQTFAGHYSHDVTIGVGALAGQYHKIQAGNVANLSVDNLVITDIT